MSGASVTGRICSWVEGNLDKDFTLEEMSEELNYSKFYMERVFKENTGTTIYRYVQGRRLEEAARKLAETKQPVVEIALETGYGSQQAFARAFRCVYGCTPREYRRSFVPGQNRISMLLRGNGAGAFLCRGGLAA
ncbi:MAG: AraC family transcriptional regulator [Acetatifactor sp.]|nr:AraC family transcriptional regulator [Acetatifactor sp.]